jgi:general secretion pathway protein D
MRPTERETKRAGRASLVVVVALLASTWVFAQEPHGVPEDSPFAEQPPVEAAGGEPSEDRIPVNLNNLSIDQVVQFLGENTGKVVIKSAEANAQITVASPEPVTKPRAVELVCSALRLEGVAVIERDETIYLVPVEQLPRFGVETVSPDEAEPTGGLLRKAIDVGFADVERVQQLVQPLLAEGEKVVADARSRKIIITAAAHNMIGLERLVGQLDVLDVADAQVRIFQLEYAEATDIAPIVEALLADVGAVAGPPAGEGERPKPGGAAPGKAVVVPYAVVNWLLVRGPEEVLEKADSLIRQLDREKPPELDLNVIMVRHANAGDLARQLSELFQKRPQKKSIKETIEVTADERSNALMVLSSPENFALIQGLVEQLDTEKSRTSETRSYQLVYADAEDVADQLNDLYSGLQDRPFYYYYYSRGRTADAARFVPERRTNSLIVIAKPADFLQIEDLIAKLDQPLNQTEVSPRIYRIQNIDAKEMTEILTDVFGGEEEERTGGYWWYMARSGGAQAGVGRLYGKVRFVHEPTTNSVIVITNNKENFAIIEELIREMDRTVPEYANTVVHHLEHANATDMADQLNSLFARRGAGERPDAEAEARRAYYSWLMGGGEEDDRPISNLIGKVRFVPDPRTNSLLITTAVQNFEVLRRLIEQLDTEEPKVLVGVRLFEVIRSDESRIGTRWSSDPSVFESKDFNNGFLATFGVNWEEVTNDTVLTAGFNVAALIQFLQREFGARILSEPTIVVNNNTEANLFVGSEVPFIKESIQEPGTIARSDSYDYKNVGTELKITPHINRQGKVVTDVEIKASQVREGEVLFGALILDSRTYNTEVAVGDGETLILGGIMRVEQSQIVHRIPILGHIPILGLLFRKRDKVFTTTELVAFITPQVLETPEEAAQATRAARESLGRPVQQMREQLLTP